MHSAARAAVLHTAADLLPGDADEAQYLGMAITEVLKKPVVDALRNWQTTFVEALSADIGDQCAVLDDASLTATGSWDSAASTCPAKPDSRASVSAEARGSNCGRWMRTRARQSQHSSRTTSYSLAPCAVPKTVRMA